MSTAIKVSKEEIVQMLSPYMTNNFNIVYGGFRVNHMGQGVVALQIIGASKNRIQQYINHYLPRLEKPSAEEQNAPYDDVKKFLGSDRNFFPLVKHYEEMLKVKYNGDVDLFVAEAYMDIHLGIIGKALHGILQLGYGYYPHFPKMICEGFALINSHYMAPSGVENKDIATIGLGSEPIDEVLKKISLDEDLRKMVLSVQRGTSGKTFVSKITALYEQKSKEILRYAQSIKLPNVNMKTKSDLEELIRWLIQSAIFVYTNSQRTNDFFILHGVTGAWALSQIVWPIYEKLGLAKAVLSIQSFVYALLTVYITQGAPNILTNEEAGKQFKNCDWPMIIEKTLANEVDVHIYKVVQVLHEIYEREKDGDARLFLLNKRCADLVMNAEFQY